jgi:hypothetical protein
MGDELPNTDIITLTRFFVFANPAPSRLTVFAETFSMSSLGWALKSVEI